MYLIVAFFAKTTINTSSYYPYLTGFCKNNNNYLHHQRQQHYQQQALSSTKPMKIIAHTCTQLYMIYLSNTLLVFVDIN